jgi:hypothetical protein
MRDNLAKTRTSLDNHGRRKYCLRTMVAAAPFCFQSSSRMRPTAGQARAESKSSRTHWSHLSMGAAPSWSDLNVSDFFHLRLSDWRYGRPWGLLGLKVCACMLGIPQCCVKSSGWMTQFTQSSEKFQTRQNCVQSCIHFMSHTIHVTGGIYRVLVFVFYIKWLFYPWPKCLRPFICVRTK